MNSSSSIGGGTGEHYFYIFSVIFELIWRGVATKFMFCCLFAAARTDFDRPFWSRDLGGMQSTDRTKLYYVGIIDILTHWTAKKKLEHVARVLQ